MATRADQYRMPAAWASIETRVRGSRFLAEVFPAESAAEAGARLAAVRRERHDATHHCSAWRLGPDGLETRFDDDGEPSGTAGMPILRQVEAADLTQVLVVVTRWFGGTKLGTGGLARAYGDAAREALSASRVVVRTVREPIVVRFAYEDTSPAMHVISRFDAEIVGTAYSDDTVIRLAVRRSEAGPFREAFVEALRGRGSVAAEAPADG
jgi:uncharacterized YigZ family protein